VNNQFNLATATLQVRGVFANPKPPVGLRLLSPGQFVRVRVPVSPLFQALLVSESAVGTDQDQKYIFVVSDQNKVDRRAVQPGTTRADGLQVIAKGLDAGERVIVSGLQRVKAGMVVNPKLTPMPQKQAD